MSDFSDEDGRIIQGWKRRISGKFVVERHLKKGSVFILPDDNSVYMVNGQTTDKGAVKLTKWLA